ncbi:MAG: TonB-dependent receptor [Flavobacteriales bacterium]|nr:TonB-dependent receptor [Flavobacteriales bacterium]
MKLNKILSVIVLLVVTVTTFAQGTIRGFVYDEKSGEPVIFTNVFLKGTTMGSATDVNGFYSITKVPAGSYTLMVTSLGYDTAKASITIKGNEIINQKLFIKETMIQMATFNISAEKTEATTEVKMSVSKVTPKEIQSMPSIGGDPDLAQYLQVLPGVTFTGDQGGQLYIRGGSPVQNKVLLDGMIIYNPFHSIGLFSVFDTDIMRNADVYTGGFGAQYGGRVSSIMDITTRDGNKKRLSGKVSASSFGGKVLLEGPLKKEKKVGGGSSSFVLSGKHSYLEQSSKIYQSYFKSISTDNARGIDTTGLPYGFTDIYGKVSFNSENGSKFNLFGFNFKDQVNFSDQSKISWDSYGGGSNFVLIPGSSKTLIEGVFAYSKYKIDMIEADGKPRTSNVGGFNGGMTFTTFSGDNEFKYGFDVLGLSTNYEFTNAVDLIIQQTQSTTELGGFMSFRWNLGNFVLEPGVRVQYYASLSELSPEPRLGMKYNLTEWWRVKAAAGMYSQNLISANSDRDIVNLFYGFISGPDNLQENFTKQDGSVEEVKSKLQKANHAIFGFEFDLNRSVTLNTEGYYKAFTQLTNTNRNKIFPDNSEFSNISDELKKDYIIETGNAYGLDFSLKYTSTHLNVWAIYSLSKVNRWDGITEYNPVFDRRHNVNLVAAYIFGKNLNWEFNARWNLGSGFPFTQTQGFYEGLNFSTIDQDPTSANGNLEIAYADFNKGRLPYYHRLDLTLKRTFIMGKNTELELNASVTNAYNRENIFYLDRVSGNKVYQLPILPSFGMSFTF